MKEHNNKELEGGEIPNISHRAHAWTDAAASAKTATKNAILDNTKAGQAAVGDARQVFLDIKQLMQENTLSRPDVPNTQQVDDIWTSGVVSKKSLVQNHSQISAPGHVSSDLWSSLNGNLGVLNTGQND